MNMPTQSWSHEKSPESYRERSGFHLRPPNIRSVDPSPWRVIPYNLELMGHKMKNKLFKKNTNYFETGMVVPGCIDIETVAVKWGHCDQVT